jgi:hypothetical protein
MISSLPPMVSCRACAGILVGLLVVALMPSGTVAAAPLHEESIAADRFSWQILEDGSYRLNLEGGRSLLVTDEADLPALDLLLLVPAAAPVTGVRIEPLAVRSEPVPGTLASAGPLVTSTGESIPVRSLEPEDGVFPATWGRFGGLHSWHGYRLLAVTVHPVRLIAGVDGQPDRLEFLERFAVHAEQSADWTLPAPLTRQRQVAGEREALEATLQRLVANPISLATYQRQEGVVLDKSGAPHLPTPNPSLEGSGVRFLIVTTEAFAPQFQRLADHRTSQGLPAQVVTREWIEANHRQGVDFQSTLRMFLQEAYAKWGVEFLLLGGDTEFLPPRYVRSTLYPIGGYTDIPTDLYFAALDGDWNANGNGWLGEPYISSVNPGDFADLAPELVVGRATVRTLLGAQQFVDKVLTYELAPAGSAYGNKVLFAAERLFTNLHGAQYAQSLIDNIIEPCTDMESVRMYEADAPYPYDIALSLQAFIQALNTAQYGQVNQFGHGHFFNMSMANANFTVADADALTNAPNFFLLFALNCASAAYDYSCLMERFVENPGGGSIMSIGAARAAFPTSSFNHQSAFYQAMSCERDRRAASAFNTARMAYVGNTFNASSVDRWTQLNAVVIGDPAISIWNRSPLVPEIAAPSQLEVGEQVVLVQVSAGGEPIGGADVCLMKDGETYSRAITDSNGDAWMTVIPQTAGELLLTVSGMDLARTETAIPVASSPAYVRLDDLIVSEIQGNQNGAAEAGEILSLQLELRDVGGAGAVGLSALVTTEEEDLIILSGASSVPDVPPGGTVLTSDPILVRTPATVRDGTSLRLRVTVNSTGGESWISQGELEILAPEPEVVRLVIDDTTHGNGDGVPQSGERLVLWPYLKNYGAGLLDQVTVQLVADAPGVTIHQNVAAYPALGLLAEATYQVGALSLTLDDIATPNPAHLVLTDNHGRSFTQLLEFNPPPAPSVPEADASLASDTIALRWEPSGGDRTLGYHVYRALAADGPFERVNQDLLVRTSYFEENGLQQLTPFWFKVSAVDTFMVESAPSPVVHQSTMPAELDNFPLPFQLQTSGHPAVGDVTGDGRPEIVIAADEVYVWRHDGTEVRDGDDDPQTTGPFTNVGGGFSPAGVVLANLDDQPGSEIIVSLLEPSRQIHIYNRHGEMLPGWPRSLLGSWNWATPAVGDVTGDGFNEIVVNDLGGRTFVWRHDGTELRDGDNDPATDGVFVQRPESWGFSSPALYDVDGDGAREIIFGTSYGNDQNALLAYKADGTQAPGFPFVTGTQRIICSPAIADLDGSGTKEIIFFTAGRRLYVLRADGSLYDDAFPLHYPGVSDLSLGAPSPAVGDFDDDGDLEIVWPVNSGVDRMDLVVVDTGLHDGTAGTIMTGWPVQLPSNTEASPVVGDINGDGRADIIQPVGNSSMETPDRIYALNADGSQIAGFPISLNGHPRSTPALCDLNGDGYVNIVYGSWDRLLHVWAMPFPYDPHVIPWPTFQGNNQRTGEVRVLSITEVPDSEVPAAFTVLPPYPNPFNPATTIRLYVAPGLDSRLDVTVYDLRGRRVRDLHGGASEPGWRELTWDGNDAAGRRQASGVYFVQARQADQVRTFKVSLVK